jgi:hypothetical protein
MTTQDIIQYSSIALGVFGIIVGLYQGFERKKLKQYMYSQAWNVFTITQYSLSSTQQALKIYKETYKDNLNAEVFEQLARCDAYNINLFGEAVRQIQLSEPKFNLETITTWKLQGRINDQMATHFVKAMQMKTPGIASMVWQTLTLKIRQRLTKSITQQKQPNNSQKNE